MWRGVGASRTVARSAVKRIRLSEWARSQGIARITAYRMLRKGILPVPAEQSPTGRWYVLLPPERLGKTVAYARATPGRGAVDTISRQVQAITEWAALRGRPIFAVVTEVTDPLVGPMPKLMRLLASAENTEILIQNPDVMGIGRLELIVSALAPQGRVVTAVNKRPPRNDRRDELYATFASLSGMIGVRPRRSASHPAPVR